MCYLAAISEWFNNERFLGHHNSEWVAGAAIILSILVSAWFLWELWKRDHKRWFWVVLIHCAFGAYSRITTNVIYTLWCRLAVCTDRQACLERLNLFHSHPIGISIRDGKKSGWHGSLTLSLDKGDEKKHQTNRIQTHCSPAALQSDSAAPGAETCAGDRRGLHGAIL